MTSFLQFLVECISLGMTYGISTIGFILVFRLSRVLNFTHATFVAMGAFLFIFISSLKLSIILVILLTLSGAFSAGLIIERLIQRPLKNNNPTQAIILSIGIFIMLKGFMSFFLTTEPNYHPEDLIESGTIGPGIFQISDLYLLIIFIGAILFAVFGILLKYSSYGIYLRAISDNNYNALSQGIRVRRISALAWANAALFASISGIFLYLVWGINPLNLNTEGLKVFPVAILGGMYHYRGAFLGGLIVGLLETFVKEYISVPMGSIVPYVALLIMIPLRPSGFFQKISD